MLKSLVLHHYALGVLFLVFSGCASPGPPKPSPTPEVQPAQNPPKADLLDTKALIDWVQKHRDQTFIRPVVFSPLPQEELPKSQALAPKVSSQVQTLTTRLESSPPDTSSPIAILVHKRWRLARYDQTSDTILYAAGSKDKQALRLALVGALMDAMHQQRWPGEAPKESLDRFMAYHMVRLGSANVMMLLDHLQRTKGKEIEVSQLMEHPEYMLMQPELFPSMLIPVLESAPKLMTSEAHLGSLHFVGALYRSQGWTGVELALVDVPTEARFAYQAKRWMGLDSAGVWTWPDWLDKQWSDLKVKETFSPGLAWWNWFCMMYQTKDLSMGIGYQSLWVGDSWRTYLSQKGEERVVWVMHWGSPDAATRAASLVSSALKSLGVSGEVASMQSRVVVILWEPSFKKPKGEDPAKLLLAIGQKTRLSIPQREGFSLPYIKTPREHMMLSQTRMELDRPGQKWRAPGLGIAVDLKHVAMETLYLTREAENLRWWAAGEDAGTMVQMSVNTTNPLGAAFDSDAYGESFKESFEQQGNRASKLVRVTRTMVPTLKKQGWAVEIAFEQKGQKKVSHMLFFPTKNPNVLGTLSVTGSPEQSKTSQKLLGRLMRGVTYEKAAP